MRKASIAIAASFVAGALVGALGIQSLNAQQPGFKRAVLQKQELTAQGRDAVVALAEFIPGGVAGRHTHPGEELGYVVEGTLVLEVDGRAPQTLKAGDVFFVEAGRVHDGKNTGSTPAKVLATYIVERGKPVATPAK
jgi:quercetin dioxygenase-like cupin family protein